ncbi:MAG: branched-chain amino acid ABC transporter permease [Clostridiales bacterium]|nr:branched-chain amino acid ABC transporter permease [Clostridiales bacterium]
MKNKKYQKLLINVIIAVVIYAVIMMAIQFGWIGRQYLSMIVPVCTNVMLAVSLCLIVGFLGELTLGHAAFMSVGAYSGALVTLNAPLPSWLALGLGLIVGGIVAALAGVIIGVPVLRLRGDYLAIVTLGFGEIIKSIFNTLGITGGASGLTGIPMLTTYRNFTLVFILTVIVIIVVSNLVRSRQGRAICAIRDNYIAAEAAGIKVSKYKVMAFVISAFFAGVAGVVYAHNISILKPGNFDYNQSIEFLVMVVLGGMGNIKGSIIAAIILTLLPEVLRGVADYRMLVYSIVLIAMMLFNNSKFKAKLIARKNMRKTAEASKEA